MSQKKFLTKSLFLVLISGLFQVIACTDASEPKQVRGNYDEPENKTYTLDKISEISEPYASEICHIEVDPDNKENVLFWTKSQSKETDDFVDKLAWWKGEKNFSLENLNKNLDPIVVLGNFHQGRADIVSIKADIDHSIYTKGRYILNSILPSDMLGSFSPIDLSENKTTYTHNTGCAFHAVKLRTLPNGNRVALVRARESLELLIYGSSGKIWSKILETQFHDARGPWFDYSTLTVSKEGKIAVLFEGKKATESSMIVVDANGQILKTQSFGKLESSGATWLDENNIAVLAVKLVGEDPSRKDNVKIHLIPIQENKNRTTLSIDMKSNLVDLDSFKSFADKKLLITGKVDFSQATGGSVGSPSKAFVGVYDLELQQFVFEQRISGPRANMVTTTTEYGPGEFLIAIAEGPLTHDESRRTTSSLYHFHLTK